MAFTLPNLPYAVNALEPHIDAKTMEIHHGKHHATYISKLNDAIKGNAELESKSIEDLISKISALPENIRGPVRNNGGGHINHSMFWTIIGPKSGGAPKDKIAEAINRDFGSFDKLKEQFAAAALNRFGSGWAWLCADKSKKLVIGSTPNQDNPLMDVSDFKGTPIFGLDVWEHAYYLNYQNRRPDYVAAFWNIINWNEIEKRFTSLR